MIDGARSWVRMTASSNVHPIHGESRNVDGFIDVAMGEDGSPDVNRMPVARLELALDSIATGNALYDAELARRTETRKYPWVVGELRSVADRGHGRYQVAGDLTLHGVTRPIQTEMTVRVFDRKKLEAQWTQTIDIRDFNLTPPRILTFKVDPRVEVEVKIEGEAGAHA
ncbi:MAG: YceI family protein [Actinobacteria bacterium]|nr:YceI family protein [Actinomycetota bacterium]